MIISSNITAEKFRQSPPKTNGQSTMSLKSLIIFFGIVCAVMAHTETFTSPSGETFECKCSRQNFFPICASDGETYDNWCYFDCVKTKKPDLEALFEGDCSEVQI